MAKTWVLFFYGPRSLGWFVGVVAAAVVVVVYQAV
jgi:hypothetical protein